jgi:hypothetical protein
MTTYTEYKLLVKDKCHELNEVVTKYLNAGWILYGNTFATRVYWAQAVVKPKVGGGTKPKFKPPTYA